MQLRQGGADWNLPERDHRETMDGRAATDLNDHANIPTHGPAQQEANGSRGARNERLSEDVELGDHCEGDERYESHCGLDTQWMQRPIRTRLLRDVWHTRARGQ